MSKPLLQAHLLHQYQKKSVDFQCSLPQTMMWMDMGLGKTIVTLTSIVHLKMSGFLRGVIVVAPKRVCHLVWRQEAEKWAHTKHLTFSVVMGSRELRTRALLRPADVYLINYENLGWLAETLGTYFIKKGKPLPFNGLVWDECFVKGTLVKTPGSHIAIDDLGIGDIVLTHLGPRRVLNTMKRTAYRVVDVTLTNGAVLRCTPNHPFLANGEWVVAGNLKKGDLLDEAAQYSTVRTRGVPDLRSDILEASGEAFHMFETLCEYLEDATTRDQEVDYIGRNQSSPEASGRTWRMEQGFSVVRGDALQDERVTQETESLASDGWKRDGWLVGRESDENGFTVAVPAGVHSPYSTEGGRVPDSLQDRLCRPIGQDCDRDPGAVTQHNPRESAGCEETILSGNTRVESVVYHESGSGVDVWNIHVEDAETYYVGGVLVHNCSKMKNSTTNRVKSFMRIANHFDWVTGLTGTPASNGFKDLHGQYLVVDKGARLGVYKTAFKTKFFFKPAGGEGSYAKEVPFKETENEIKHLIGDITLEMSAEDYNPLPKLIVNNIEIEMTGPLRDKYDQMEREMFLHIDECGKDIEIFNQVALMAKCLAEGTEVLTINGWKRIETVTSFDLVWDGIEWVSVSGIACNGYKSVVECWGVEMTPDHKVLTERGWREAQEVLNGEPSEGLNRAAVRTPVSACKGREQDNVWNVSAGNVASSLRLWERIGSSRSKPAKPQPTISDQVLRVHASEMVKDSRDDSNEAVGHLAKHALSLLEPRGQGLEKLRRSWDQGVSRMGCFVRVVLDGYVQRLFKRTDDRTNRRERELRQGKLPLGNSNGTNEQYESQRHNSDVPWSADGSGSSKTVQPKTDNNLQKDRPGLDGDETTKARVYDIINSGPRHRFTVRGKNGEIFIAHNCLQYGNGNIYPVSGAPQWEPIHTLKLDALEEIIDEAQGQPVFLSYAYKSDAESIMTRFKHLDPINLTDCQSESSLNKAMARWKSGDCPLMIAHPASAGHGIDGLQVGGYIVVWYGLTYSLDLYDQMNARLRRQGQPKPVVCHRIMITDTLDQAQAMALDSKATTQTSLRKAIKDYRMSKGV